MGQVPLVFLFLHLLGIHMFAYIQLSFDEDPRKSEDKTSASYLNSFQYEREDVHNVPYHLLSR